jgi:eukaryotic-like serine/threonine-protein kinase
LSENSPELLSTVAASISDGAAIEWDVIAQQLAGEDDDLLPELKLLEQIARFHQTPGGPDDSSIYTRPTHRSQPKIWAHFLILGPIGFGSSGDVYRAHDTKLQCDIALKLLRDDGTGGPPARVLKEARRLARIRHTNLLTVFGAEQAQGRVGLWMELVRGTTLEEVLRREGTFGAREASLIGLDLCRALAVVHRAGLVHGGITVRDVMRDESGRTILMDGGAGMFADSSRTKADDIYSIGVLLFHLVTNRYPVEGQMHLRALRPDLPDDFVNIVERALDADPRRRFRGAGAFEVALAGLVGADAENASWGPCGVLSHAFNSMVARLQRVGR